MNTIDRTRSPRSPARPALIRRASSWAVAACLGACALVPFALTACAVDASDASRAESTGRTEGALLGTKPGGPSPTGTVIGPGGGGWAPIPVYAATVFSASTTSDSVTMSWNEHGGNGQTLLFRQLYDLARAPAGAPQLLHTFQSLPAGTVTFSDTNQIPPKSLARVAGGPVGPTAFGQIQPDHQIGYEVVEIASGYSDCQSLPGGSTCARTKMTAYTPGVVPYGAGRAQLRIQVASTTANTGSLHVRAELAPWNSTWLDSTGANFSSGSNTTYDLVMDYVDKRSDMPNGRPLRLANAATQGRHGRVYRAILAIAVHREGDSHEPAIWLQPCKGDHSPDPFFSLAERQDRAVFCHASVAAAAAVP